MTTMKTSQKMTSVVKDKDTLEPLCAGRNVKYYSCHGKQCGGPSKN